MSVCGQLCVCVRVCVVSASLWSQLLFAGEDGAVQLLAELHIAPPAGLQKVQLVCHLPGVEALATHLCLLELVGT